MSIDPMGPPTPGDGATAALIRRSDSDNLGPSTIVIVWVLTSAAAIFISLRAYCKFLMHRGLWWDDYVLLASWLLLASSSILVTVSMQYGFGLHVWDVEPADLSSVTLLGRLDATFLIVAAVWSKTSFGITLLRITTGQKAMRMVVWVLLISMNLAMGFSALTTWVQCSPIDKNWEVDVPGQCWDPRVNSYIDMAAGIYSGLCDIALALLPWTVIWNVQMKQKEKIGVGVAMSMGVFAGATAFVKSANIPLLLSGDFTYTGFGIVVWGSVEGSVTIMAACIPVLRVLVREVRTTSRPRHGWYGSLNNSSAGNKEAGSIALTRTVVTANHSSGGVSDGDGGAATHFSDPRTSSPARLIAFESAGGKIMQTREVTIGYDDREDA